jgi:hypothetical protein
VNGTLHVVVNAENGETVKCYVNTGFLKVFTVYNASKIFYTIMLEQWRK